jgi:hypothetical protein
MAWGTSGDAVKDWREGLMEQSDLLLDVTVELKDY